MDQQKETLLKKWKLIHRSLKISSGISFLSLVKNCNHKGLGIYYLLSAFIFGISGTLISVLIRIELYSSGNRIISPENQNFYNISITLHGFLMIFFLVMNRRQWNRMDIISTIKHFFHELITFKYRKSYLWFINLWYILMSHIS